MKTYVLVSFYLSTLGFLLRMLDIATQPYPRTRKITIGFEVFAALLGLGFAVWAGVLIFS